VVPIETPPCGAIASPSPPPMLVSTVTGRSRPRRASTSRAPGRR
jgi:hypothetical protein